LFDYQTVTNFLKNKLQIYLQVSEQILPLINNNKQMTIGKQITQQREKQQVTTAELAKRSGVSTYMIKLVETKNQNASVKLLERIASALGCELIINLKSK
jgi:DNA-binding XRE family transcriptional regulator